MSEREKIFTSFLAEKKMLFYFINNLSYEIVKSINWMAKYLHIKNTAKSKETKKLDF